jgi:hypothetical protein
MKYNRRDIIQAWLLALLEHQNGQNEYNRLKRLQKKYPQYAYMNVEELTDNGFLILRKLRYDLKLNRSYF